MVARFTLLVVFLGGFQPPVFGAPVVHVDGADGADLMPANYDVPDTLDARTNRFARGTVTAGAPNGGGGASSKFLGEGGVQLEDNGVPLAVKGAQEQQGWGEHRVRIRDDCTKEERDRNWGYVLDRGQVRESTVYWDQRVPPGPTCQYAQVIQTPAFAPEFRKVMSSTPYWMNHWAIAYFDKPEGKPEGTVFKSEICEWAMCDVPDSWLYWHPKLAFVTSTISRELGMGNGSPVTVCGRQLEDHEMYQTQSTYGDKCDCGLMWQAENEIRKKYEFIFDPFTHNCRQYIAEVYERCVELQLVAAPQSPTLTLAVPEAASPVQEPGAQDGEQQQKQAHITFEDVPSEAEDQLSASDRADLIASSGMF